MDIYTALGWQDGADLDQLQNGELFPCITLGYLLAEKGDRIVLCSSVNIEDFCAEITVIPRGCVKRIHRLGPVRRKTLHIRRSVP